MDHVLLDTSRSRNLPHSCNRLSVKVLVSTTSEVLDLFHELCVEVASERAFDHVMLRVCLEDLSRHDYLALRIKACSHSLTNDAFRCIGTVHFEVERRDIQAVVLLALKGVPAVERGSVSTGSCLT
jgi:hypothetical protein